MICHESSLYLISQADTSKYKQIRLPCLLSPVSTVHGGDHVFIPFAMEDGGRIGAHGLAFLKALAEHNAVSAGKLPPHSDFDIVSPGTQVGFFVDKEMAQ